jgi:hypothetical protein
MSWQIAIYLLTSGVLVICPAWPIGSQVLLAGALCVHSVLEGMALGAQQTMTETEDIMIAIAGMCVCVCVCVYVCVCACTRVCICLRFACIG